ncbi:MAG TPA: TIGR03435 family protein, partial [Bryobacteraceae bacterium]|nr:TIGR03435 family protein [Bryobacteraceae bacterium]
MTHGARQRFLAFALGLSFACSTAAQESNASSDTPRFEVASIKLVDPKAPHTMGVHVYPGGRVVISGFPLKTLILAAFDLGWWQLSAGEEWMSSEQYAVTAQPPEALRSQIHSIRYTLFNIDDPMLRRMLQSLLVDR